MKKRKEKVCSGAVSVRLSPAQVRVLVPELNLLVHSYFTRKRSGSSPLAYPFRIYPPPPGFDRGAFDQTFMDKTIGLEKSLKSKSKYGCRIKLDTWRLRGALFAARVYVDYIRMIRRKQKNEASSVKKVPNFNSGSLAAFKSKSKRVPPCSKSLRTRTVWVCSKMSA